MEEITEMISVGGDAVATKKKVRRASCVFVDLSYFIAIAIQKD